MRAMLLTVVCSINLLAADREMNVAICNQGGVNEFILSEAKSEVDLVYSSAGVRIVWQDCEGSPDASWFMIRLRNDKPPRSAGAASLDVMGKAFVEDHGGYLADAYFQAVEATAQLYNGNAGVLLGFVMSHELGHLLLGTGHTRDGVMQPAWGRKQMDALRQRWLKFSEDSAGRIRLALETRTASVK
jgi:hypothetical protein